VSVDDQGVCQTVALPEPTEPMSDTSVRVSISWWPEVRKICCQWPVVSAHGRSVNVPAGGQ
jgi:hypothetical protein